MISVESAAKAHKMKYHNMSSKQINAILELKYFKYAISLNTIQPTDSYI